MDRRSRALRQRHARPRRHRRQNRSPLPPPATSSPARSSPRSTSATRRTTSATPPSSTTSTTPRCRRRSPRRHRRPHHLHRSARRPYGLRSLRAYSPPQPLAPPAAQPRSITSGAGHDAMIVARRVPAAMLFLRSPGGLSHHPDEAVLPARCRSRARHRGGVPARSCAMIERCFERLPVPNARRSGGRTRMHNLGHTRSANRRDHLLHTPDTFVRTRASRYGSAAPPSSTFRPRPERPLPNTPPSSNPAARSGPHRPSASSMCSAARRTSPPTPASSSLAPGGYAYIPAGLDPHAHRPVGHAPRRHRKTLSAARGSCRAPPARRQRSRHRIHSR